jgi:biopolymer transport protein ExbB/TolQ
MFSQGIVQGVVDGVVVFATDLLMPAMGIFFVATITLRVLMYYTVKREEWFSKEFAKRVKKFQDARNETTDQSFYVVCKRLLEITYYEVFEIRSIMKRRNPDAIMTVTDRVFLVQQGSARIVHDLIKQTKYLKWGERPKFLEISNNVLRNNPCFNKVFGIIPVGVYNDFLNTVPGLFIVGGIFGTFLGIMKALPELGGMNLADVDGSKLIMDNFLLKISFSMSTSIIGIILSVTMSLANTFFSCEKVYMETVERFENELDTLWNMSSCNKLPAEITNFDADRDPIEVLSEDLIAKELNVEVGFVNLIKPISKWWNKKEVQVTSAPAATVSVSVSDKPASTEDKAA